MPPAFHKDDPVKLHRLIHEARLSAPEWPLLVVKESMTNVRNGVGSGPVDNCTALAVKGRSLFAQQFVGEPVISRA